MKLLYFPTKQGRVVRVGDDLTHLYGQSIQDLVEYNGVRMIWVDDFGRGDHVQTPVGKGVFARYSNDSEDLGEVYLKDTLGDPNEVAVFNLQELKILKRWKESEVIDV